MVHAIADQECRPFGSQRRVEPARQILADQPAETGILPIFACHCRGAV